MTDCTLPFGILEVFPLRVPSVGLLKPLSHTGLSQYQTSGAEEMGAIGQFYHVRMDLKRIVKYRLTY